MEILVLNQGSSSIKCALYRLDKLEDEAIPPLWHAEVKGGIEELVREKKIDVVGHRIVHGGDLFHHPVLITSEVKKKIKSLAELAPLHQGRGPAERAHQFRPGEYDSLRHGRSH